VALLRSFLEIAQYGNNVLVLDHLQQSIIHFSVAEVGNHLVVCCPSAVFIVECLVQGMDFCFGQIVHESSSVVKNGDGSDAREQQHQLTH
jgi:hypothetical protein